MALKNGQHLNREWSSEQYRHTTWAEAKDLLEAHTVTGTHLDIWQSLQNRCYLSSQSLDSKKDVMTKYTSRPAAKRNGTNTDLFRTAVRKRGTAYLTAVLWKACLLGWSLASTWNLEFGEVHTIPRTATHCLNFLCKIIRFILNTSSLLGV